MLEEEKGAVVMPESTPDVTPKYTEHLGSGIAVAGDQLLAIPRGPIRWVPVPEIGPAAKVGMSAMPSGLYVEFLYRTLDVDAEDANGTRRVRQKAGVNAAAELLVRTCVNANNERLFRDEDVTKLGNLPHALVARLFDVARDINGLTDDAAAVLEKNSG
jgi:hypothetical protein